MAKRTVSYDVYGYVDDIGYIESSLESLKAAKAALANICSWGGIGGITIVVTDEYGEIRAADYNGGKVYGLEPEAGL